MFGLAKRENAIVGFALDYLKSNLDFETQEMINERIEEKIPGLGVNEAEIDLLKELFDH